MPSMNALEFTTVVGLGSVAAGFHGELAVHLTLSIDQGAALGDLFSSSADSDAFLESGHERLEDYAD